LHPFFVKANGIPLQIDKYFHSITYSEVFINSLLTIEGKDIRMLSIVSAGDRRILRYQHGTGDIRCLRFKSYSDIINYTGESASMAERAGLPVSTHLPIYVDEMLAILEEQIGLFSDDGE
jgi:hypothetical protein